MIRMRYMIVVALFAAGCGSAPTAPTIQALTAPTLTAAPELAKPCLELLTPLQPPERLLPKKNYHHDPC